MHRNESGLACAKANDQASKIRAISHHIVRLLARGFGKNPAFVCIHFAPLRQAEFDAACIELKPHNHRDAANTGLHEIIFESKKRVVYGGVCHAL